MPFGYREQYERMLRWHARLAALDHGRKHTTESDNYVDDIYAFFMNCYHLKDWIRNDPEVPTAAADAVEDYINSSMPLKLCADICNSLKHFSLAKTRSGENPSFGRKKYRLSLGSGVPIIGLTYEIETVSGTTDVHTLAGECVTAWDEFASLYNLQ